MLCHFTPTETPGILRCEVCGQPMRSNDPPERTWRTCGTVTPEPANPLPLGDYIESGLKKLGISQERVKRWLGDCNCPARIERLNKLGKWIAGRVG